ncbi:glycosyltransferase [Paenibacillus sp. N1-5-1-14]|uniref:MGDG synthase family glycosyltransferase n=1 Tax=Paenibacillus radicibacter TaxID=2972488 RepID=UPI002158AF54|nr:glycosyltransferase [Paenibacillus radicibacter]MCR8645623.1 glycosyltransferase [Paenibacillus radicibacter]
MRKEKVVILSGNFGDGHRQAAQAVRKFVERSRPNAEAIVIDFMELAHPHIHSLSRYIYMQGIQKFPSIYGFVYNKTRSADSMFGSLLKKTNRLGLSRLMKQINAIQPSVIVSTFPLASGALSELKEHGLLRIPTMTVITDHTSHSYWVYPHTDKYIVGSEKVRQELYEIGVGLDQVEVAGIPVRDEFKEAYDRNSLMMKHGLNPNKPVVLMMGGGCGLMGAELVKKIHTFEYLKESVQFLVICGSNERVRLQLEESVIGSKHDFRIMGYIDYVHELMAIADTIVTKPGGLTISEAMTMQLPIVIYKPLPGQEEDNARFLLESGAAMQAESLDDLVCKLSGLFHNPMMLEAMRMRLTQLYEPLSSTDIADIVFSVEASHTHRYADRLAGNVTYVM